jgi:hypothetical protein
MAKTQQQQKRYLPAALWYWLLASYWLAARAVPHQYVHKDNKYQYHVTTA